VNFHRPCFFAETLIDPKGKVPKRDLPKDMMMPSEKLKSLPKAKDFLMPGCTFVRLIVIAMSDNEAARRLNEARTKPFQSIHYRSKHAALIRVTHPVTCSTAHRPYVALNMLAAAIIGVRKVPAKINVIYG
jgi:hypothetical protein